MLPYANFVCCQVLTVLSVGFIGSAISLGQESIRTEDYARAEQFLEYNINQMVLHSDVRPNWLGEGTFWYRITTERGKEFILIDSFEGIRRPAFDQDRLALAISGALNKTYSPYDLPFDTFRFSEGRTSILFRLEGIDWECNLVTDRCIKYEVDGGSSGSHQSGGSSSVVSPDGKREVFVRNWNLWVRDVENKVETQLTADGIEDYGYATDNAGWRKSDRPIVVWSPDSKKIKTFRQDQRNTGEMYLVDTRVGHPILQKWKYPLPVDDQITMIERVVVDVEERTLTRLLMKPDQHRSTLCDDLPCRGRWRDVQWSSNSSKVAFVSTSRDHKVTILRVADSVSGEVRNVFSETVKTFFESGNGSVNWFYLPESNEVIWFSERDNWGHLYLYDLTSGQPKNPITKGKGNVTRVLRVDEEKAIDLLCWSRSRKW